MDTAPKHAIADVGVLWGHWRKSSQTKVISELQYRRGYDLQDIEVLENHDKPRRTTSNLNAGNEAQGIATLPSGLNGKGRSEGKHNSSWVQESSQKGSRVDTTVDIDEEQVARHWMVTAIPTQITKHAKMVGSSTSGTPNPQRGRSFATKMEIMKVEGAVTCRGTYFVWERAT